MTGRGEIHEPLKKEKKLTAPHIFGPGRAGIPMKMGGGEI